MSARTLIPRLDQTRMRLAATGLLVLMAVVFVITKRWPDPAVHAWVPWVHAFSEAAMVGALADWFAVTALFRHPLGIPVPHTAIVPLNKDRIGATLGEFVQSNFLSSDVLGRKIADLNLAGRVVSWLGDDAILRRISTRTISALPSILNAFDDHDLRIFARSNLNTLRKNVRLAPAVGKVLQALAEGDRHQHFLNEALRFVEGLLERHEVFLRETLRHELPWYVPNFVHDKVYHDMVGRIRDTLHRINADPAHPVRGKFAAFVGKAIEELNSSPAMEEKVQQIAAWIFESPLFAEYLDGVWSASKRLISKNLSEHTVSASDALAHGLKGLGTALARDHNLQEKINLFLVNSAQHFAHEYQEQISALVTDTVKAWDAETVVSKIEEHVGRDLQYIRINGTVVGGLVGLILFAVSNYLG